MKVEKITITTPEFYKELLSWSIGWATRGVDIRVQNTKELSQLAFYVPDLAIAYVYLTNSSIAIVENMMKNPHAPKKDTTKALDSILIIITEYCRLIGITKLIGMTKLDSVIQRAEKHGYKRLPVPYTMVIKDLQDEGLKQLEKPYLSF